MCSLPVISLVALAFLMPTFVLANQHICSLEAYRQAKPGMLNICGQNLMRLLGRKCPHGVYVRSNRANGEIHSPVHAPPPFAITVDEANQMLSTNKRNEEDDLPPGYDRGLNCECCIHRCAVNELRRYCRPAPEKKKRAATFDRSQNEVSLTQEDIDNFYANLENVAVYDNSPINITAMLVKFYSNPLVQAYSRNEQINSKLEQIHRASEVDKDKRGKEQAERYKALKNYLKSQLIDKWNINRDWKPTEARRLESKQHRSPEAARLLYRLLNQT